MQGNHYYHNDLTNRSHILLAALTGNAGQFILDNSVETKGMTMDGINEKPRRFVATSKEFTSDIKDGIAYYGL